MTKSLRVFLWHQSSRQEVGELNLLGDHGGHFTFARGWPDFEASLTLSLAEQKKLTKAYTDSLPPLFSNLLAEEQTINRMFLEQKLGQKGISSQQLLALSGRDLTGAIEITGSGLHHPLALEEFNANIAGVQPKVSVNRGLMLPVDDSLGPALIKFPNRQFPGIVQIEFACLTLAKLVGINVPAVDVVDVSDFKEAKTFLQGNETMALRIERFDRTIDGGRIHTEDFAQIFGVQPQDKYKQFSQVQIGSKIAEHCPEDFAEYVQRLVFLVLIGNGDMHLKNWSVYFPDGKNARLAPAYDFVSTILFLPHDDFALKLAKNKAFSKLDLEEFKNFGHGVGVDQTILEGLISYSVTNFLEIWAEFKASVFTRDQVQALDDHIGYNPLVQHFAPDDLIP